MSFDFNSLLRQYVDGPATATAASEEHFQQVAQNAPPELVSQGLAAAFRSDATPAFGQMAGQLFGQSSPNQQAGMLNQLISGMGPSVLASLFNRGGGPGGLGGILGGLGGGGLGALLGQLTGGGAAGPSAAVPTLTPEQASTLTPEQVQDIATHAEESNPGIVDQISRFYAEHPTLVKAMGGVAMSIALSKMAESARR